jgi:hypothetical protein
MASGIGFRSLTEAIDTFVALFRLAQGLRARVGETG